MAVPQFHGRAVPPMLGERERGMIVDRLEFAEVIDVTAEAVHEVQAIVKHPRHPRVASRLLSLIHKPDESAEILFAALDPNRILQKPVTKCFR